MQILQKLILNLALLLCIYYVDASESKVRRITKYWSLPSAATAYGQDLSEEHDRFIYSICSKRKSNSNVRTCNIISEIWPFKDATVKNICSIELFTGDEEYIRSLYQELYIVNRIEVLLVFTQVLHIPSNHSSLTMRNIYNIIDRKGCAIISNVTIDSETMPTTPIIYKNSFTFIAADKVLCKNNSQCLVTYDWKNEQIHAVPIEGWNNIILLYSVSPFSSDKGYYLWTSNSFDETKNEFHTIQQHYKNEYGDIKKLVNIGPVDFDLFNIFVLSNANEQQSICWKLDDDIRKSHPQYYSYSKRIRCVQTDTQTMKLNVTLELPEHINWVAVYNLKEGGMLVATGLCSPHGVYGKANEFCQEMNILKINADGKKDQILTLGGFEFQCRNVPVQLKSEILENENEFCFVLVCGNYVPHYDDVNLGYHKTCIKKEYISLLDKV